MKPKDAPKPINLISKDTFALVLEELLIIEQQVTYKAAQNPQFQSIAKNSGDYILRNYNISFEDFDSSFTYYNSNQVEMKQIYDSIIEKLNLKTNSL